MDKEIMIGKIKFTVNSSKGIKPEDLPKPKEPDIVTVSIYDIFKDFILN